AARHALPDDPGDPRGWAAGWGPAGRAHRRRCPARRMRPLCRRGAGGMTALRWFVPLLGVIAAGCAQLEPFATVPEPKPATVSETGTRVGICYDPVWSKTPKVAAAAQAECGVNTTPERVATDYKIMVCPVLLPARDTFVCTPNKAPAK